MVRMHEATEDELLKRNNICSNSDSFHFPRDEMKGGQ